MVIIVIIDICSPYVFHKLREYHYEMTKDMTTVERIKEINDKADEVEKEIEAMRAKRIAV